MTEINTLDQNDHDLLIRIDTRLQDLIRDNNEYKRQLGRLEVEKCSKDEMNEKISIRTREYENKLEKYIKESDNRLYDHEKRMRKMERWLFMAAGALVILQFIIK